MAKMKPVEKVDKTKETIQVDGKGKTKKKNKELAVRIKAFKRGPEVATKHIKDKKLRGNLRRTEKLVEEAAVSAAKTEQWLLPAEGGSLEAEGMERTYRFKQEDIVGALDASTSKKAFDLSLPELGPYKLNFTANGKHMCIGGRAGHLAVTEWARGHLVTELQVKETVRDVTFLHNETFFAAAQKKYVYIYDKRGLEVHCLREHSQVHSMQFLPNHFLLATIGKPGILVYQDTSTGTTVAELKTKMGCCETTALNPWNAVMNLGHHNGVVSMWSPNMASPLVRLLSHRGPVRALSVDREGRYLATAGQDCQVKVWDLRTYKPLHSYFSPAPAVDIQISQRNLLAVAYSNTIQVWKDALWSKQQSPYMTHRLPPGSKAVNMAFCPYEDVLGVGHTSGVSSLIIPGAGEPNFDSFVANPFLTVKQRREQEVHKLLDKLPPDSIVLNPDQIGRIKVDTKEELQAKRREAVEADLAAKRKQRDKNLTKTKMKGKNRGTKKHRKKQQNVIDDKKYRQMVEEKEKLKRPTESSTGGQAPEDSMLALKKFYQKPSKV